jgi:hypothetical protein
LTGSEQRILGPIYNWRGLTVQALEDNLKEANRVMNREQKLLEAAYPGLKDFSSRYEQSLGLPSPAPSSTHSAPESAINHLKAHPELKEQFKEKYGYLPEGM